LVLIRLKGILGFSFHEHIAELVRRHRKIVHTLRTQVRDWVGAFGETTVLLFQRFLGRQGQQLKNTRFRSRWQRRLSGPGHTQRGISDLLSTAAHVQLLVRQYLLMTLLPLVMLHQQLLSQGIL
jgi:hypothetical protein